MYFGLLMLGVTWLVLVSPPPIFLPYPFHRAISVVVCFETSPDSLMLPYLRGRGPISPMFARLPAIK
jgi:hypothetical protein